MESCFHVLGADIALSGPADVVQPIRAAYRRFLAPCTDAADAVLLRVETRDGGMLSLGDRRIPLVPGIDSAVQVYQRFVSVLMGLLDRQAVLHAAALADGDGAAFLLAAPSGHGKTSLTLELASRGYGFLGDDYAPLDLGTGCVHPFPRAVGLAPGGAAPIPEPFRRAAAQAGVPRMAGKTLLDVGSVLGERAVHTQPAPLRRVLLLGGAHAASPDPPAATLLDLAARPAAAESVERELARIDGVEVISRIAPPPLPVWRLRVRHDRFPSPALDELLGADAVVFCEKHWEHGPDFGAAPSARRLKRREAATYLGREMLNRMSGGRLLERYGRSLPALFLDLAGALRDVECWGVRVGRYAETADLIERLVGPPAGSGEEPAGAEEGQDAII